MRHEQVQNNASVGITSIPQYDHKYERPNTQHNSLHNVRMGQDSSSAASCDGIDAALLHTERMLCMLHKSVQGGAHTSHQVQSDRVTAVVCTCSPRYAAPGMTALLLCVQHSSHTGYICREQPAASLIQAVEF